MIRYGDTIREIAKKILEEKTVDLIIGFKKGTLPITTEPVLIKDAQNSDQLYWDSFCNMNLIKREQLYIIGVPCKGMIDRRKIVSFLGGKEVREVTESDEDITIKGEGFEHTLKKNDYLQDNCRTCMHRNPVIYDAIVGDLVKERKDPDPYDDVKEIEGIGLEGRWESFSDLIKDCIRCYACRNACPLCYCPTCFVDESDPQWVGKSIDPTDTMTFHILRAYHCTGRCTDCGACQQACPMDINVRTFTRKLNKDVLDLYGCEAGLSIEERPPLDTYKPDDYDKFIR